MVVTLCQEISFALNSIIYSDESGAPFATKQFIGILLFFSILFKYLITISSLLFNLATNSSGSSPKSFLILENSSTYDFCVICLRYSFFLIFIILYTHYTIQIHICQVLFRIFFISGINHLKIFSFQYCISQ